MDRVTNKHMRLRYENGKSNPVPTPPGYHAYNRVVGQQVITPKLAFVLSFLVSLHLTINCKESVK